jgi:1-aminocyclopropane-1-carboxylate synthase
MLTNVFLIMTKAANVTKDLEYHDNLSATYRMYYALAGLLNSYFHPASSVVPDHMVAFAGCSPAIENFARAIANEKENPEDRDIILTVSPYYAGFKTFTKCNNITLMTFPLKDLSTLGTPTEVDDLRAFYSTLSPKQQANVKGVIICNPHNPLGRCYQRETIIDYGLWCESKNVHLLSDEIYAFSVFSSKAVPDPVKFTSILSINFLNEGVHPGRIHVIYGMSKDFDSSGFRIGVLVSQHNLDLVTSVTPDSWYSQIASPPDVMCSALLNDPKALSNFITNNQANLKEAYEFAVDWFKFHAIPHTNSNAGHFTLLDFAFILKDVKKYGPIVGFTDRTTPAKFEGIFLQFLLDNKVLIAPGTGYGMPAGWFRFTFSMRRDYLIVGLKRLEVALQWPSYPYPPGSPGKRIAEWFSDTFYDLSAAVSMCIGSRILLE